MSACEEHAWQVVRAVTTSHSYRAFFRLYDAAPHLSAYLMDFLVQRVRNAAYDCIVAAYRPAVSVDFFRRQLHFGDDDQDDALQFLQQRRAVWVGDGGPPRRSTDPAPHQQQPPHEPHFGWIDCKASQQQQQQRSAA
jgi:hypothetical protein